MARVSARDELLREFDMYKPAARALRRRPRYIRKMLPVTLCDGTASRPDLSTTGTSRGCRRIASGKFLEQ
jgi:hypothetical protein